MDGEILKLTRGGWARFDRYEIRPMGGLPDDPDQVVVGATYYSPGFCITPAQGAKLLYYDPWRLWEKARPGYRKAPATPPYQQLLEVLRALRRSSPNLTAPSVEGRKALLEWCANWGLLGILLHRTFKVTLASCRTAMPTMPVEPGEPLPVHVQYRRLSDGWAAGETIATHRSPGAIVSPTLGSILADLELETEPLSSTWGEFFPAVPAAQRDTFQYPMPLSEDFWRAYAEPLWAFLDGAIALERAIQVIAQTKPARSRETRETLDRGEAALRALVRPIGIALKLPRPNGLRYFLTGPSLLAHFAAMAIQDLSGPGRATHCRNPTCGRIFVSSASRKAAYCCDQCRWAVQKRAQRAKPNKSQRKENS